MCVFFLCFSGSSRFLTTTKLCIFSLFGHHCTSRVLKKPNNSPTVALTHTTEKTDFERQAGVSRLPALMQTSRAARRTGCTFVRCLCLVRTVFWKSYVFTILKYLFLPHVIGECVVFIALSVNTHSSSKHFLQSLLDTRGWCVEGGCAKAEAEMAGQNVTPRSRASVTPKPQGPHPDRSHLCTLGPQDGGPRFPA